MTGILLDPQTGDLAVNDGALVIGDVTSQTIEHVLLTNRGEVKIFPMVGAEVVRMRKGTADAVWCAAAKSMLRLCGVPVSKVYAAAGEIYVE